jgi:hypothetical protein
VREILRRSPNKEYNMAPIKKDVVKGTYDDLMKRIEEKGVQDKSGPHPGEHGNTRVVPHVNSPYPAPKKSVKTRFWCGVKKEYYDTIAECQDKCPTRIGTIPCIPVNGVVCLTATVTRTYSVDIEITRLEWSPSVRLSSACAKDVKRWYKDIEMHERRHETDVSDLIKKRQSDSQPQVYKACAETEGEAQTMLNDQISADDQEIFKDIKTKIEEDRKTFHDSDTGGDIEPPKRPVCQ